MRSRNVKLRREGEAVIVRVWRAKIDPGRIEEYRRFEQERYMPMLRKQPGLLGGSSCGKPKITRCHSRSWRTQAW